MTRGLRRRQGGSSLDRRVKRLAPIIVFTLVYLLTPGAFELTENVLHLVGHGDTAHGEAGHSGAESSDEHGCSGPYHFCICHTSVTFLGGSIVSVALDEPPSVALGLSDPGDVSDSGYAHRIYRPPRS